MFSFEQFCSKLCTFINNLKHNFFMKYVLFENEFQLNNLKSNCKAHNNFSKFFCKLSSQDRMNFLFLTDIAFEKRRRNNLF
jgi:hypothetical protein